jgi:hypothetical protein
MNNNANMFPEDPQDANLNGNENGNDELDFGETLEDFEDLIGTEDDEKAGGLRLPPQARRRNQGEPSARG